MFKRLCLGVLVLAGLVLSFNGCNTNSPSGLTTIVISPATVTVEMAPPGFQQGQSQFKAIGYYGHAGHQSTQDITSQVTWSSSGQQVAKINSLGLATATGFNPLTGLGWIGITNITASAPGFNGEIVSNTATFTVTSCTLCVGTDISAITVLPATQTVASLGVPVQFVAVGQTVSGTTVALTDLTKIQWVSSVPSVATINATSGVATTVAAGTTTITVTYTNTDGSNATGTATLTVAPSGSPEPLTALAVAPNAQTALAIGQTAQFLAIATTGSGTSVNLTNQTATVSGHVIPAATWTSSNPSVASINPVTGVATSLAAGVSVITAIASNPDGSVVTGASTYTVTVSSTSSTEPLVSLAILPAAQTSLTTGVAASVNFIAIGTTSTGATVNMTATPYTVPGSLPAVVVPVAQWNSSNPSVASFTFATGGVATPKSAGATAITAIVTNPDGSIVTGSAAYTVTVPAVTEPYVSLAIVPASQTLTSIGQQAKFIAIGTTGSGTTVDLTNAAGIVWSTSSSAVATITNTGLATAVANGAVSITATVPNPGIGSAAADGTSVTASGSLTVAIGAAEPLLSLTILPGSQSVAGPGQTNQFLAIGDFSASSGTPGTQNMTGMTSTYTVTWYSSNPAVATIDSSTGLATAVGQGTTAITAIAKNILDKSASDATATFTVTSSATNTVTGLSIYPASQTVTMPVLGQADPVVNFVVIGTTGTGLQANETTSVSWTSSNPAVATFCYPAGSVPAGWTNSTDCPAIINSVLVLAVGSGTTTLTATYTNLITTSNPVLNVVTATANLIVSGSAGEPLLSLAITPVAPSVPFPTQTYQLSAIGTFSLAPFTQNLTDTVVWSSSNPLIATVCNAATSTTVPVSCATTPGLVKAVKQGTAAITATDTSTNLDHSLVMSTVPFTVTAGSAEAMTALTIIPGALSLSATGQSGGLIALGTSGSTGLVEDVTNSPQLTWVSSNPTIATVCSVAGGTVTANCATTPGVVSGVSAGSSNITAEFINQVAVGSTPAQVVTAQASVDVTATPAAEPLLSITALPSVTTDLNLEGNAQFLAYGTFSTAPTVLDITNGFFHAGFPSASCTAAFAAANAAVVAQDSAANLPVTTLPHAECSFIPVTWISTAPYIFPINSAGTAGATGGLSVADGSGNTNIYAVAANPDSTLVYSPMAVFNCPYAAPTYGTKTVTDAFGNTTTVTDFSQLLNPGTCNTLTIADSLLSTLTVFNAGVNTTGWLITADSATHTPDVIHCGGSVEQATPEGSVCEATYPNGTQVILTAPAAPGATPAVKFGGWSSGCTPCTLAGGVCTTIAAPPFYTAAGPNSCKVIVGGGCTLNINTGTYTCTNSSNMAVGAIFN